MDRGFFSALFDLSFSTLVTTRVIKFIYVITLIVIGLAALFFVVAAFAQSAALGVLTLIVIAPVLSLLYVIYARVLLEVIIALFRLVEYNRELVALKRRQLGLPLEGLAGAGADTWPNPSAPPPPPADPTPPASPEPPADNESP
ncbi:MAG TPA: DUF4282 domain-containing protein [Solirubrobacteraceae bacterium]|jgi:hypothetical protein